MKCHESKTIINLYLDGEASEKQQAGLFSHLKECAGCRQEMSRAQHLHELLTKSCTLEEVPPNFRDSIMSKIALDIQVPPNTQAGHESIIPKRKFIESRLGVGLIAGAAGLLLTYYLGSSLPQKNIASQNAPTKLNVAQKNPDPKANVLLAEGTKTNPQQEEISPGKQVKPTADGENTKTSQTKPQVTAPLQVPSGMVRKIAKADPIKGAVDLPKPLSISSYIYDQNQVNNFSASGENNEQPLNKLKATMVSAKMANRSLQIITKNDGLAHLWQIETTTAKTRELSSLEASGVVVNSSNKLLDIPAVKAAVSSGGTVAALTKQDNKLHLTIGEKSTLLDGNVISNLTWSPDGTKIVYFLENSGMGHLESFDGVNRRQLTPEMPVKSVSWTFVTESKLILNIQTDTSGIYELQLPEGKLKALTNVGGGQCVEKNSNGDIAFTDTSGMIYVLLHDDAGIKKLVKLTTQEKAVTFLTWVTDKTILYTVSGQDTELWKIALP